MTFDDKRDVFIPVYTEKGTPREIIKRFNDIHSRTIRDLQKDFALLRVTMVKRGENITELDYETDINYTDTKML